jgi:glycosyltransferase involved in cell wall biosynthesis
MKVLLVSRTFYPEGFGGGEISALHIAKTLSKDSEVVVCCLSKKINKETVEQIDNVKIYRYPWKELKFSTKLSNLDYVYHQMKKAIEKVIIKESPDILHFLNFQAIFSLPLSFKNYPKFATINSPLFCEFGGSHPDGKTCHNCSTWDRFFLSFKKWGLMGLPYWGYNRYSQNKLKRSLRKCSAIFPVSNAIKKMLISGGIDEKIIKVIHNPIETKDKIKTDLKEKLNISPDKKVILYAGRLSKDKGVHLTINAIKDIENTVFIIAGEKRNYYNNLKELVNKLNLNDRVKFIGFIDNLKMKEYFSITDLVVHPCFFYEPLSRMLLEATSYGIPIIASKVGGNPEIVEEGKSGFLVKNTMELKEKIKELVSNDLLLEEFGKNSKKVAEEKFSYKKIRNDLTETYNSKSKSKNIVFLTRDHPTPGGRTGFTKDIINSLGDNYAFKVICFENKGLEHSKTSFNPSKESLINTIEIKKKFKSNTLNLIDYHIKSYKILKKLKNRGELNTIVGTGLSALGGAIFGKLNNIPTIFNTSGIRGRKINEHINYEIKRDDKKKVEKPKITYYPRFLYNYLTDRLSIFLSTKTTIPTHHLKNQLEKNKPYLYKKTKNKFEVIIEGLNKERVDDLDKENIIKEYNLPNNKIILFSRVENEEFFQELFDEIKKEIPDSTVISIDAQRMTMRLEREGKLELTDMGPIKAMLVSNLMFCIPGTEPHSTLVLESLYTNCPTFVSNVGWLKHEFKDHPEFIIKHLTKQEVISKIKDFYKNQEIYIEKFKKVKKEVLERNDFKNTKENYKNLFDNLSF